jgi:DTW domain-containing protein YfiP
MRNRSRPHVRCETCYMRRDLCFCRLIEPIHSATKVLLVVHRGEAQKPTNTARLIKLLMPQSDIRYYGLAHEKLDIAADIPSGTTPLVLFPEPSAPILDSRYIAQINQPITLIVPDGTWKQARKIAHRLQSLSGIPRVRLAPGSSSRYQLRRNQAPQGLCTIEAVSLALEAIEGPSIREQLDRYLSVLIERVQWARRTSQEFGGTKPYCVGPASGLP